ncbi:hypothetical protein AZF37_08695 [endosymbiont 'TC1' of Trimyema compressum]|uniref:hypothetical protein n=1 Tax=endosymbiont 'TC1' of Trimyema compressum TaxID=243899 RepID=UPI0007F097B7|nr:hypothetical protein [endosymbiont 'TC1' of Trimyema compressum]AMP21218.1 hypothetical protein AZF37_08695 [endosymbiont 'TC1' of Trimyema compressum]
MKKVENAFLKLYYNFVYFFIGSVSVQGAEVGKTYSELFEDQNLGKIVAAISNKGLGDNPTEEELSKITKLVILEGKSNSDFQIVSLKGLANLKNLKHLEITNNLIKEIPREIGSLKK